MFPNFSVSPNAIKIRQFLYEFWCAHGSGPNLRDTHEAIGLSRRDIMRAYREPDLGVMIVIDQETENVNLLKCMPFSAFPSHGP
jgi:hypothetical protein